MTMTTVGQYEYMIEDLKSVKDRLLESEMNEAEKKELINMLLNVIDDVKESDPEFKVKFFNHSNNHHETYLNFADMCLNKLYSDIENIVSRLKRQKMNVKYMASILNEMIQTNLYLNSVQNYINETSLLQEGEHEINVLKLSDRLPGEYTVIAGLE